MNNIIKIITIVISIVLFGANIAFSQYYSTGQDRSSIKWREINTSQFHLIYPNYYEKTAQKLANKLSSIYLCNSEGLNHNARKITILLHTESARSNGYVAWAPKRSEFYATPSDWSLSYDWLDLLAVHEYRHVIQLDKLQTNVVKVLSYGFGEQVVPIVLGLAVPWWFLEGDATMQETLMSKYSGRGRSGEFTQNLKAFLLSDKKMSYDKGLFGSYKEKVPNRYELGYYLVANTRKNYGKDVWGEQIEKLSMYPWRFSSFGKDIAVGYKRQAVFNKLLKDFKNDFSNNKNFKSTEIDFVNQWDKNERYNSKVTLFYDNITELRTRWKQEHALLDTTDYKVLSLKRLNYKHPKLLDDGSILALRLGVGKYSQFVKIKDSKETVIYTPGSSIRGVSREGNLLIWTEIVPHIRWEESSKSVVYILNMDTGKKKMIKTDLSLYAPSLDRDCSRIVAINKNRDYTQDMVVIDIKTAKVLHKVHFEKKKIGFTIFTGEDKISYLFAEGNSTASLAVYDLKSGTTEVISPTFNANVIDLSYKYGKYYIVADFKGKNDIYTFEPKTQKITQLTESKFGAVNPYICDGKIIYSNYTVDGYNIVEVTDNEMINKDYKVENDKYNSSPLLSSLLKQKSCKIEKKEKVIFPSNKYSKASHLFNIHSWSPLFSIDSRSIKESNFGISLQSHNILSTMFMNLGYIYFRDYKYGQAYANLKYAGWYPILSLNAKYGRKKLDLKNIIPNNVLYPGKGSYTEEFNQLNLTPSVSIPFNLSRGKYTRYLNFGTSLDFISLTGIKAYFQKDDKIIPGIIKYKPSKVSSLLEYNFNFANIHKKSNKDIYSPFGQRFGIKYQHRPFNTKYGYTYSIYGDLYLPSFINHNGIKLSAVYQHISSDRPNVFTRDFYIPTNTEIIYGRNNYSISANYVFPLFYPDYNLGSFIYLKRVKGKLFYDYMYAQRGKNSKSIKSFGIDITTDSHFLRLPVPIELGVSTGFQTQTNKHYISFVLRASIYDI